MNRLYDQSTNHEVKDVSTIIIFSARYNNGSCRQKIGLYIVKTSQFEVDIESDFLKISNTHIIIASCIFFLYTVCDFSLKKQQLFFSIFIFKKNQQQQNNACTFYAKSWCKFWCKSVADLRFLIHSFSNEVKTCKQGLKETKSAKRSATRKLSSRVMSSITCQVSNIIHHLWPIDLQN